MKKRVSWFLLLSAGLLCSAITFAQNKNIKGKVTDSTGAPVPGASVSATGVKGGVVSKPDGSFELSVPNNATLHISMIGF